LFRLESIAVSATSPMTLEEMFAKYDKLEIFNTVQGSQLTAAAFKVTG
jgi:hypothetical protein